MRGYGKEKIGYQVYLLELDKIVTSAHELFDKTLPAPRTGSHAELEELVRVKIAPGEDRTVQSYSYLMTRTTSYTRLLASLSARRAG